MVASDGRYATWSCKSAYILSSSASGLPQLSKKLVFPCWHIVQWCVTRCLPLDGNQGEMQPSLHPNHCRLGQVFLYSCDKTCIPAEVWVMPYCKDVWNPNRCGTSLCSINTMQGLVWYLFLLGSLRDLQFPCVCVALAWSLQVTTRRLSFDSACWKICWRGM